MTLILGSSPDADCMMKMTMLMQSLAHNACVVLLVSLSLSLSLSLKDSIPHYSFLLTLLHNNKKIMSITAEVHQCEVPIAWQPVTNLGSNTSCTELQRLEPDADCSRITHAHNAHMHTLCLYSQADCKHTMAAN